MTNTITNFHDRPPCFDCRGSFGFSGGFGRVKFGLNKFGFYSKYAGIYSRKKLVKGWGISKMQFYRTPNPQTIPQQARRLIFSFGVLAWRALPLAEKNVLEKEGRILKMSGFNLYMSRYLKANI